MPESEDMVKTEEDRPFFVRFSSPWGDLVAKVMARDELAAEIRARDYILTTVYQDAKSVTPREEFLD